MVEEGSPVAAFESNQHHPAAGLTDGLGIQKRVATKEPSGFVPGHRKAQARFDRRIFFADVVTPVAIATASLSLDTSIPT
jgi:hypothetical protein